MNAVLQPDLRADLRQRASAFVVRETGVSTLDLISRRRDPQAVMARALFVWIADSFGRDWVSSAVIGRWLGERDHTTILYYIHTKAPSLQKYDPHFRALCEAAEAHFGETGKWR